MGRTDEIVLTVVNDIKKLKEENVQFKTRLDKALEFAEYVNNQFGYGMPQGFFTKYDELIAKAQVKLDEMNCDNC